MNRVRVAVIGAGAFGRRHLAYLSREPSCEIAAIADPTAAAAEYARAEGLRCFADHREMLDTVKPDGAIIATPNALHVPVGLACAERGVHMLVEKPLADTVEAARALSTATERAGSRCWWDTIAATTPCSRRRAIWCGAARSDD